MDGYFSKQTSESFVIDVSFANNLVSGESVTTVDVKAYLNDTDVTNDVIEGSSIISNIVYIRVKGGKNGRKYKLSIKVETSDENTYESDVEMHVLNI